MDRGVFVRMLLVPYVLLLAAACTSVTEVDESSDWLGPDSGGALPDATGDRPVPPDDARAELSSPGDGGAADLRAGEVPAPPDAGEVAQDVPLVDPDVAQYDVYELTFSHTGSYDNPYLQMPGDQGPGFLEVTFSCSSGACGAASVTVDGFWDGGTTWKARMSFPQTGQWEYSTASPDAGLNGVTGSVVVGPASSHGLVHMDSADPHKFIYSDGTPFFWLGQAIDWPFQTGPNTPAGAPSLEQICATRGEQGFTVLVNYSGPGLNKPLCQPNDGGAPFADCWIPDNINLDYWHDIDKRIGLAAQHGLAVTLALSFQDTGMWGIDHTKLYRLWRYIMARYGAYPALYQPVGEYEEGGGGNVADAVALGEFTEALDRFDHPTSMHAAHSSQPLAGQAWFDYIIHQTYGLDVGLIQGEYSSGKAIVEEEFRVGSAFTCPESGGVADEVRKAAWAHFTNGAYFTLTEANWCLNDDRTYYLVLFRDFVDQTGFQELKPYPQCVVGGSGWCVADPAVEYVVYLPNGGEVSLDLSALAGNATARWYDPREGVFSPAGAVGPGNPVAFAAPGGGDWALHVRVD